MSPPCTAKEDQPGPTGLRQISTGGEWDQSVAIVTPWTTLSRLGPRKPGHSGVIVRRGAGLASSAGAACWEGLGSTRAVEGLDSTRGTEGVELGVASSCCSAVADQRQANAALWSPSIPSVRTRVQPRE